jgi:hypothetical protein
MRYLFSILLQLGVVLAHGQTAETGQKLAMGHLPVVITDDGGTVHLVFGQDSTIYYATGQSGQFGQPVAVATLSKLVTTAKRGPQVAATNDYVVITAVTRGGDVFGYSLDRRTRKWSAATRVNDVPAVALEGFQAVAGATKGTFHSVWLDLRDDKQNKIVGATSTDGGRTWSANRVIYRSPGGTVCECCKVSIAARNNDVYVQFRNFLDGSRDLHLAHSTDGGKTFPSVQKLGTGTWKLNACPMDGGVVVLSPTGQPLTAWRRETMLYTCEPGQAEQAVATGKNVTMASGSGGSVVAWDDQGTVWLKRADNPPEALGKGQMPSLAVAGQSVVCVWEANGQVMLAKIAL